MQLTLAASELRDRIVGAGHEVPERMDETAGATDVCRDPHTIVTVGLYLDPTLKPEYRDRYFVCLLESPNNPVPARQFDPAFALAEPFPSTVEQPLPRSDFMDGPFVWLLHRLRRFRQVLLWPANRCKETVSSRFDPLGPTEELPRLREWLRDADMASIEVGAIVLNLAERRDCAVLREIANTVSDSGKDWYVSDPECKEVYLLHHHDKIIACVPDRVAREAMLQELADREDLIEDCSCYDFE